MLITFYDSYTILNKVYHGEFLKQAITNTFIDEKTRSLTTKICYGVLDKDIELSYYINELTDKSPKLVIRTILKIAMYCEKYLKKPNYAVTKNAVELTKKLGKGGTSGFVNAFLRKFSSYDFQLPKDKYQSLSVKYSYPLFAVKELIADYGEETALKIISSENVKTCLTFYEIDGEKYLSERNVKFTKTPYNNVFLTENFVRNSDYDKGVYTYQALGSVAICENVYPSLKLLDTCSAPGGKSVRLSYKCKDIVACDIHPHRVELIKEYKNRMHRDNIKEMILDATEYNKDFVDGFDAVFCDVPCSGFGVLRDNPDMALNKEISNILELNEIQKKIISNCSNYVKVGGYLYYSTCSVFKKENIEIIEWFIKNNDNFEIEKSDCKLDYIDFNGTCLLLPNENNGLGFYFAKLKRIK